MPTCSSTLPTTRIAIADFRPAPSATPDAAPSKLPCIPRNSDYYYFVADAQGHHRFARTIEEHNKNVVAYRKAMRGK